MPKPNACRRLTRKTIRCISLRFHDQGSTSRAKPHGVHGSEIHWSFSAAPPAEVDDLTASEFCANSPHTLVFAEGEQSKTVYFCLRWENTTDEKGPWSEILSAIVP